MANAYKCDRCGKLTAGNPYENWKDYIATQSTTYVATYFPGMRDFCPSCTRQLVNWVRAWLSEISADED